jgi:hypothetical protein
MPLFFIAFLYLLLPYLNAQSPPHSLTILENRYPKTFFFRISETYAANNKISFETWEENFSRLQGIIGKCLDEELKNRSDRNINFFTQFKAKNPQQIVLLHYNGIGRDPEEKDINVYQGHWVYYNGQKALNSLSANDSISEIEVRDTRLFKKITGRENLASDDIGICRLTPDGKPDWSYAEQVQLLDIRITKAPAGFLKVKRAQYNTQALDFTAGKTYLAAHKINGPWGAKSHSLWLYNLSTCCPLDAQGKTAADRFAEEVSSWFSPTGKLAAFDGIEFDVMQNAWREPSDISHGRAGDFNADGVIDDGYFNDQNLYGAGATQFLAELRKKLGPDKFILADGWNWDQVRAFSSLNGMESEGWPKLNDPDLKDWSGGLNRAQYWNTRSFSPKLSYFNHKLISDNKQIPMPYSYHRLVFAAATIMEHAICCMNFPTPNPDEICGIWDEFVAGKKNKLQWLGSPTATPRYHSKEAPLLYQYTSETASVIPNTFSSETSSFQLVDNQLILTSNDPKSHYQQIKFTPKLQHQGDVTLWIKMKASQDPNLPPQTPRVLRIGKGTNRYDYSSCWIDETAMEYRFQDTVDSTQPQWIIDIDSSAPVSIESIQINASADIISRPFENGLVIANIGNTPYNYDLKKLHSENTYSFLQGTPLQDTTTNNGTPCPPMLTIPAKDAIFLIQSQ